ncbi:TadE/TadG family type IV pilus assembly protein [Allosphingosinicella deserti]|uniref:Putative Flp pilus-assembly TadG-like N-terminal domain-containing protein n=1 Tax=Allosphingosinicella deserti TaxID=2116704 RepID=A0A2P7QHK0_9SPHN|nr:TadE/TadG family type IV pilus assembly protein [Sphingomonas deserti]PSJ37416.1 hypothetical protein C7I55_23185 [Sphingomonas deserti]
MERPVHRTGRLSGKDADVQGFLTRLLNNKKASVLPMMAAAMIPLIGIIGSGLDMSRAYLAKARLQTACDAAALGARRAMAKATELDDAAKAEGLKFFDFNFPVGLLNTPKVTPVFAQNGTDPTIVEVTATAQVPTTLMRVFGKTEMEVKASCSADQDYVNNDIMLVLDVTASMNCAIKTGDSCAYKDTKQPDSRLAALDAAAKALYKALEGAKGVRTRYGFMPYSMTVNVGGSIPTTMMQDPGKYHTYPCTVWNKDANGKNTTCKTYTWTDVSKTHSSWDCVEERPSSDQTSGWPITIKTAVTDDDIDKTGTTATLKWQPYDPSTTNGYSGVALLSSFCPAPAARLAVYNTETAFQNQVTASLAKVGGYTHHDLGIVWGMRFLSGSGMFKADNPDFLLDQSGRQIRVERHIVFLTDGVMTVDANAYSSFGIPKARDRLSAASGDTLAKHKERFLNACNQAKAKATIWVIALDVGSGADQIKNCASGDDHFFQSTGTDLEAVFRAIGKGIGKLRVVS